MVLLRIRLAGGYGVRKGRQRHAGGLGGEHEGEGTHRARCTGSAGSSGGAGKASSSHSTMASDWVSTVPSSSSSAGTRPCGLSAKYSGARCSPRRR